MALLAVVACVCLSGQLMAGWHVVQPGDTLWSIARRCGTTVAAIKAGNGLVDGKIYVGQRLRLDATPNQARAVQPKQSKTHIVQPGESLWSIARTYGLGLDRLKELNKLQSDLLRAGQRLIVLETGAGSPNKTLQTAKRIPAKPVPQRNESKIKRPSRGSFAWPLRGRVVEKFGVKAKSIVNGITITASSKHDVTSAASGEVAYADTLRGYGQMVIVRHAGGYHSVYAHLARINVRKGQEVVTGTVIGQAGSVPGTGRTGVHFQLYSQGKAVDPLVHLRS